MSSISKLDIKMNNHIIMLTSAKSINYLQYSQITDKSKQKSSSDSNSYN